LAPAVFAAAVFDSLPPGTWSRLPQNFRHLWDVGFWEELFLRLGLLDHIAYAREALRETSSQSILAAVERDTVIVKEHAGGLSKSKCQAIIERAKVAP
jgi:hypothetical protein